MSKKQFGDYYLGLDIGTDSIGWAVTDPDYEIMRFNSKAMWGVHLFPEGKTAAERRAARIARRRLDRRKKRIDLLRELFDKEISSKDPMFFARLDESNLVPIEKKNGGKSSLFNDNGFSDKDYHTKYPTIYHLRKDLMDTDRKPDIRLVYLALAHILKHRGHFLYDSSDDDIPSFKVIFDNLQNSLEEMGLIDCKLVDTVEQVSTILKETRGITLKKEKLKPLLSSMSESDETITSVEQITNALAGGKFNLVKMFGEDIADNLEGTSFKNSFNLSDPKLDEEHDSLEAAIDSERMEIVDLMKTVNDWALLSRILSGSSSISEAKIKEYNQHRIDLKLLKKVLRSLDDKSIYDKVMRSSDEGAYPSYSGMVKNIKGEIPKSCNQESFCDYVNKILKDKWSEILRNSSLDGCMEAIREMRARLDEKTFMPLQSQSGNSILPNAVHRKEAKRIVENMSRFYLFLKETDDDGLTVADKIVSLCTFRMPYYVGPVGSNTRDGFKGWAVKYEGMEKEPIRPWNWSKVIDVDSTSENFIANLISMCSYIRGEPVLPKNSILFCRFKLYNEINAITINGVRIDPYLKNKMVKELFEDSPKRVTISTITKFIQEECGVKGAIIKGIDTVIKSNLEPEYKMKIILGEQYREKLAEDIIHTITVFGDDRKRLLDKLTQDYGNDLPPDKIMKLSSLKFRDWGSVSEKLLRKVRSDINGMEMSIIEALRDTNLNFMELLSGEYGFKRIIDSMNDNFKGYDGKPSYKILEDMRASPAVKHAVWRCTAILADILKVTGHPPKKVFVETTREHRDTGRTISRKDELISKYKEITTNEDAKAIIASLEGADDARLRGKKLFSYYSQLGRCMYCGRHLDLAELDNNQQCDMDHIYPQSLLKDDSIRNNMVLTCRECNDKKGDRVITLDIQKKMKGFWSMLKDSKLISDEKYSRLTRTAEFSDEDKAGFINRQLVETNQTVKCMAEMLKAEFGKDIDVVYVKGSNVSDFRQYRSEGHPYYIKCRNVNDNHHAKDAYLNIVVGNVYDVKFTKDFVRFVRSGEHYNINKMYKHDVARNGVTAWKSGENGTIATVDKWMRRDNILFTRHSYISTGELSDANILKKGNGQLPIKQGLSLDLYGGYNKVQGAYFALFEHDDGKSKSRTVLFIPRIMLSKKNERIDLEEFAKTKGLSNPVLKSSMIKVDSTLSLNGFRMSLRGTSGGGSSLLFMSGEQMIVPFEMNRSFKDVYKYCDKENGGKTKKYSAEEIGLNSENTLEMYDYLTEKICHGGYDKLSSIRKVKETLEKSRDRFISITIGERAEVLSQILKMFHCNPESANLKLIGGPGVTGRMMFSSKISAYDKVELINQSPSGLFENKIDLKTI